MDHSKTRVWLARAEVLLMHPDFKVSALLDSMAIDGVRRFLRLRHPKKQQEFLVSRFFIQFILQSYPELVDGMALSDLETAATGRLVFSKQKGIYISLSHSHGWLAVGISDAAIGVDIELHKNSRVSSEAAALFMHKNEFDFFSRLESNIHKTNVFYKIWSAKEAYFKALPDDEQVRFASDSICLLSSTLNRADYQYAGFWSLDRGGRYNLPKQLTLTLCTIPMKQVEQPSAFIASGSKLERSLAVELSVFSLL